MKLTVHVQAGARQDEVVGWVDDELKVKIAAPPRQGRANRALIDFLADRLGVAKSSIRIIRGQTMKMKQLEIPLRPEQIKQKLKTRP